MLRAFSEIFEKMLLQTT